MVSKYASQPLNAVKTAKVLQLSSAAGLLVLGLAPFRFSSQCIKVKVPHVKSEGHLLGSYTSILWQALPLTIDSTYQLFITLGIFVANCINFGTEKRTNTGSWRIPLGISFLWVLILGVGIVFFPESPRYAYRHGRIEEAKRTMTKLYGVSDNHRVVAEELAEIKEKHEEEMLHQNQKWWEMFTGPRMAYRIALGVSLQALQQLTGANYFFYYGTVIFKSTGK